MRALASNSSSAISPNIRRAAKAGANTLRSATNAEPGGVNFVEIDLLREGELTVSPGIFAAKMPRAPLICQTRLDS